MFTNFRVTLLFAFVGAVCSLLLFFNLFFTKNDDDVVDDITDDDEFVPVEDDFPEDIDIIQVPGHALLYYDCITLDVYKLTIEEDIELLEEFTSNGHPCKYAQGQIVEVIGDEIVATVFDATLPY